MFDRRQRLSRLSFTAVLADKTAKRLTSPHFSVTISTNAGPFGCAVVVSKKIEKGSVGRHLLKRRMREALRPWCQSDAYALIAYARSGSAKLSYAEIVAEFTSLLPRLTS